MEQKNTKTYPALSKCSSSVQDMSNRQQGLSAVVDCRSRRGVKEGMSASCFTLSVSNVQPTIEFENFLLKGMKVPNVSHQLLHTECVQQHA